MSAPASAPPSARPGAPRTLVVKVGGSLVSDKRTADHLDTAAVRHYATLVADLVRTFPGRTVFVAGGGALGHGAVRDLDAADGFAALELTHATFAVKWAWATAFREAGIRAMPLQVAAMCRDRPEGTAADLGVLRGLLAEDVLPVLSGDCILSAGPRLRIYGSDHVPGMILDEDLAPVRIVTLTDVPGILTGSAPDSPVLPHVSPDDPAAAHALVWESAPWDTSGAMRGKVDAMTAHARRGAECVITRGDRDATSLRHLFAPMSSWPAEVPHTLISRTPPGRSFPSPRRPASEEVSGVSATTPPPAAGRLVLLNPGPVNVHEDVRAALTTPDQCHREPEAAELMTRVREKATRVSGGDATFTSVLFAGSGTAALEAAFSSVVPADGRILILDNGNYGERLWRIVEVHGIPRRRMEFGWCNPIDPAAVGRVLAEDPGITHVGLVHHETSTGMLNPLREIGAVVAEHGRQFAVDAISSLGSERLDLRSDHIDWCVGTANKCLEGLPGVSFVTAPRHRLEALENVPAHTFYLDLGGHFRSQDRLNAPLFTPALQVMNALDKALDRALDEGAEGRGARYAALAGQLRDGLAERGARFLLPAAHRANSVTNVYVPDGMTYEDLHDGLKAEGYVIYSTQEQLRHVFRVANMGCLDSDDIAGFLAAYDRVVAKYAGRGA
ncbi:aminotransferase class V-fold PLP-dependent enzyme [Streptomyces sp. SBT349]|uniref:aminotransferase class V-fold PLP-dependent enzyme n=1 Tax=Streptomyces sp. SBT349 TaxID=1580539 RepID=UPI000A69B8DB|nr:aminotransferase class V-fold PLP-dependent enzyme [Streptomyces sp. SBT349]